MNPVYDPSVLQYSPGNVSSAFAIKINDDFTFDINPIYLSTATNIYQTGYLVSANNNRLVLIPMNSTYMWIIDLNRFTAEVIPPFMD